MADLSYWLEKAEEYLRLSEASKEGNPEGARTLAALSASYAAGAAEMKASAATQTQAVKVQRPSKLRRRPSL